MSLLLKSQVSQHSETVATAGVSQEILQLERTLVAHVRVVVVVLLLRRLPMGTGARVKPGVLPPLQKQWQGSLLSLVGQWAPHLPPAPWHLCPASGKGELRRSFGPGTLRGGEQRCWPGVRGAPGEATTWRRTALKGAPEFCLRVFFLQLSCTHFAGSWASFMPLVMEENGGHVCR